MNYDRIYKSITKTPDTGEYTEIHHVVPRCLGGSNSRDNLVRITYRKHFICHWLLCKMYPTNFKLKAAFAKMLESTKYKKRNTTSKQYEAVKRILKNTHYPWLADKEPWNKGKKGVQVAWNRGLKTGPASEERKKKSSESLKQFYTNNIHPRAGKEPWNKGKKGKQVAWNKGIPAEKLTCNHCNITCSRLNYKKWHGTKCRLFAASYAADRLKEIIAT